MFIFFEDEMKLFIFFSRLLHNAEYDYINYILCFNPLLI